VHAGIEEVAEVRLESPPGVEYKLSENGVQSRRFSWFQASDGSSKLFWPEGFGDIVTLRCWNLPQVGQLFVDEPGGLAVASLVCPVLHRLRGDGICRDGHTREERPDLPVTLLMVIRALRLECENSMELTAYSHRSSFFCYDRESRDEAALSEAVPTGARIKER